MGTRHTFVATSLVALLGVAGVTAAIAADPAPDPPPRIAFLANGIVPADALAAGPIAGQLGAPIYTTRQDLLPPGTADALDAYDPQLVIVMGGPVAIDAGVVTQVAAATGLPIVDPSPTPASGVVRAAGGDRFETATIVADLLAAYAPAYLPVDLQAVDSDKLDGTDGSAFVTKGTFVHDAIGDWNATSGGTPVSHDQAQDVIHSNSQVGSNFPYVNNGDRLMLDSVRVCVAGGGGDIDALRIVSWHTSDSGSVGGDSETFTWDQGDSGCQELVRAVDGQLITLGDRLSLLMEVSGQVAVTATTFHYHGSSR